MGSARKVSLLSPSLGGRKHTTHDGELLYLGQHLHDNGHEVQVLDFYTQEKTDYVDYIARFKPSVVVLHFWKVKLIYEKKLPSILDKIELISSKLDLDGVFAIGSIATSMREGILDYDHAVDTIVGEGTLYGTPPNNLEALAECLSSYYKTFPLLNDEFLDSINYRPTDIASIYTSRGCRRRCSFCSYNHNLSHGWKERDISDAISDIKKLNTRFGVTKFGFFDNNFGYNINKNKERSLQLSRLVKNLDFNISISLNISLDGLNKDILRLLKNASVKNILIGLESLDSHTLRYIYNKNQNLNDSKSIINYAESIGITPVVSYILFYPWIDMDDLIKNICMIDGFGREKIVQFLSNSKVRVVPKTKMSKRIKKDGLLVKDNLYRDFKFADSSVSHVHTKISRFVEGLLPKYNESASSLSKLKKMEWNYLVNDLGLK